MKLIFISGPSGSGKTTLSNQILSKIKNGIVLNTDNYYKTGVISKLLSKFVKGYFDRSISFNYKLFKKDFDFIVKNRIAVLDRSYNYEKKTIKNFINERKNIKYLIVEGIFAKEFSRKVKNKKIFFLELIIDKNQCMERVIERDSIERGKGKDKAKNDFLKSWILYYEKSNNKSIKRNTNEYIITKNTNIEKLLENIFI